MQASGESQMPRPEGLRGPRSSPRRDLWSSGTQGEAIRGFLSQILICLQILGARARTDEKSMALEVECEADAIAMCITRESTSTKTKSLSLQALSPCGMALDIPTEWFLRRWSFSRPCNASHFHPAPVSGSPPT